MSWGLINEFSLQGAFESLIKCMACLPKVLEQFPSFSFSLIHTRTNTHISPKVIFPGSSFIDTCKKDYVFGFCLPGQMQNSQSLIENAAHSYHYLMPKRRLSCSRLFCSQGCTSGSWADSWLPYLDRSHKANLTHSGGVFQRGRCFKIHSLSQMEPKFPSQLDLTVCLALKTEPSLNSSLRI